MFIAVLSDGFGFNPEKSMNSFSSLDENSNLTPFRSNIANVRVLKARFRKAFEP